MVIYSNEIKDFLDKIYFHELTHRNDLEFPLYNYYKDKLRVIDKMPRHTPSTTFPMSRDGLFGLIVGRLEFGYSFDGINACIEYYVNREPQNDWFDWLIKESNTQKKKYLKSIINECVDRCLKKYLNENITNSLMDIKYLYHATPSCYVNSIKKYGLGGKIPKIRFWDYEGTPYENITQGCFLATDEYVAESYVENSESFEELAEIYEERFDKELGITIFRINVKDLNTNLLSIDSNQILDEPVGGINLVHI